MIPWKHIDTTRVPGGGELRLLQRGAEFSIKLDTNELMNSRLIGSEEALATFACDRIKHRAAPKILIGGLGMGFTLRAALRVLGPKAKLTVVEIVPAVIAWASGPMAALYGDSLNDPRVTIREADVGELIRAAKPGAFDAILLDVDNGPEGLSRRANDAIYSPSGLRAARAALAKDGVLAVWSSSPNDKFTERLRRNGFEAKELKVRAIRAGKGSRHVIWLATRA